MTYDLPTELIIADTPYAIRSDFRAVLDILTALNDPELTPQSKSYVVLDVLYKDFTSMPSTSFNEALEKAMVFINGGDMDKSQKRQPRLMDWDKDFRYYIAPINKALGCECRSLPYLHWWTFLSAYMEIGECAFSHIVAIRKKKLHGKKLEKHEQEFYLTNKKIIDLKPHVIAEEVDLLNQIYAQNARLIHKD